jgi:uncharacterized surface protein with fasciclin (FAS1) repeats
MKKFSIHVLLVALMLSFATIRCSSGASLLKTGSSLMNALGGVPNLSSISKLLQTPGLSDLIGKALKKPFTLLAPTNDALKSIGADALTNLSNPTNVNNLASLIKDHLLSGKIDAAGLAKEGLQTLGGKALDLGGANLGSLISDKDFNVIPIDKILGK